MGDRDSQESKLVTEMEVTQLIGLGETQRRIYETLYENKQLLGDLSIAYFHHELSLDALIKYQKKLAQENGKRKTE